MIIILPSGQRVLLTNGVGYSAATDVVTFTLPGGVGPITETLPTAANAAYLLQQLDGAIASPNQDQVLALNGSPAIINGIVPIAFVTGVTGPLLNVYGTGFNPTTLGLIYLVSMADALTGTLSNSYSYTVFMAAGNRLVATYDTSAGTPPTAPMVAIYVDSNGIVSPPFPVVASATTGGLVWSTITPNAVNAGTANSYTVAGTGFLSAGIQAVAFLILGGYYNVTFNVASDISITTGGIYLPAGTYTFYYSTDGVTYITTALTVTAT